MGDLLHNQIDTIPLSVSALCPKAQDLYRKLKGFIAEHIDALSEEHAKIKANPDTAWGVPPMLKQLQVKAKAEGLWNIFISRENDPDGRYGAGLTNVEFAFMAEEMARNGSSLMNGAFNCAPPDAPNIETLLRYATPEQKEKWLKPLLNGEIKSCFGMTEPNVASSDATNIQTSIRREGNQYVINGTKWWITGGMDPRCKFCILMGKTSRLGDAHGQQSMIIVPMDIPGVRIVRSLSVLGYEDFPVGHAEIAFENVRVPVSNILLGEGRGFEIAQGRLAPARVHHCMRTIGQAEKALSYMIDRVQNRVAFGKPLAAQSSIQQDIAKSRIAIEQCRLLILKAAHVMDTQGARAAFTLISMIKVVVPNEALKVVDRAIQAFGGMGVCQDTPLAQLYANLRPVRIFDGPDEVHLTVVARQEFISANRGKLSNL